ncbi:transporter substrate-binding domain-containing protein [Arhodomonas sp. AD133]|uniref:transporter substrate-binding domain-containing protein n=1 Tax=Arhodomonas sp. AD133 TaxID=3415009 RepID=UPI003EC03A14
MHNNKLITAVSLSLVVTGVAHAASADETSTLDDVQAAGEVRVCTTGDYKPFTYWNAETESFEGIDIDMAENLASALGVETRFVKTSWPTLMEDFTAGKCDIAMGGISVKLDRQAQAYFSDPYLAGGKTPIARCDDVERFQRVEQINQPDVDVVVNPGGTNERFARRELADANIMVHDDNTTIFGKIVDGTADVMVTDAIETELQANLNAELCAVHPDAPFTYSEKGYLLPRGDDVWKAWVDQWLHLVRKTGEFESIYAKWVEG